MAGLTLEHQNHQVKRSKGDPDWLSLSQVTTHDAIKGCGARVMNNNTGARGWLLWVKGTILRERGQNP